MFSKKIHAICMAFCAAILLSGCVSQPDLCFAAPFGDGAVLQRSMPIPVWGKAAPRVLVRCTLGESSVLTVSDTDGKFRCYLPEMSAASGLTLVVEEVASGRKAVSENIAVGDVYLFAGQSNMDFRTKHTPDWEKFSKEPADPGIRYFRIKPAAFPGPQADVDGAWAVDSPESAENFTAVGYYFAKRLRKLSPDVPVGVICASLGGMPIETFISREALIRCPYGFVSAHAHLAAERNHDPAIYGQLTEGQLLPDGNKRLFALIDKEFPADKPLLSADAARWHLAEFDDAAWQKMELPDSWTVAGFRHAGVFWFRKTVEIPAAWAGKDLTLSLGAADKCDETFFNGEKIGSTGHYRKFDHFMTPRVYTIPGKLVKSGKNVLSIRVSSAVSIATDGGLIGPAEQMFLSCDKEKISLAGTWKIKMEHDYGTWGAEFMTALGVGSPQTVHMLYDNMIHPLIPYAMRGAVWYQGEYNALAQAEVYKAMLLTLINDWKSRWGQKEFDFIIIQLPGYQPVREYQHHSQWAIVREAQRQAALESKNPLIVTIRDGEVDDIHPRNKRPVAERAAQAAFYNMNHPETWQSPMPVECMKAGNTLVVTFDKDIEVKGDKVMTLMLSSDGVNYFPAEGKIENGKDLVVSAQAVSSPEKVRYAWSNNPALGNIVSKADGTFVSPFEIEVISIY